MSPKKLSELISQIRIPVGDSLPDVEITGIALDSRAVKQGDLFVALSGASVDGHRFIPNAVERGARAVVGTRPVERLAVPYIQVEDSRRALAFLSAAFYGFPARQLVVVGVTGTDGKTTTANLLYNIFKTAGYRTGLISTVNALIEDQVIDTGFHVTTPEAPDVQRYLALMVRAGLTHVILEATSHGLAQHRVTACDFDVGVATNITHEHLDFHGSYDAYRAAKGSLFAGIARTPPKPRHPPRAVVLNRDDDSYEFLAAISRANQVSYGFHPAAGVRAENVVHTASGLRFMAALQDEKIEISTHLVGDFNVSNCLAAVAASREVFKIHPRDIQQGIASLEGVPGRMELLDLGQDFFALVDFAHTPNALHRALEAARQISPCGRVIAVFGSAGLRDRAKRRMMAETSIRLADQTILTAEDPRTESLEAILAEMADGARARGGREGENFWRIPDRGEAIRFGLKLAQRGDVVIACGKGHEQSMCFGDFEYEWDDRKAMRAALSELLGVPGPQMPYLPTQG